MDVRVVVLRGFELSPGVNVTPGQTLCLESEVAVILVSQGKVQYYSEFKEEMLRDRKAEQSRVAEAPSIEARIKAPHKRKKINGFNTNNTADS
jgi:hypothetical protein